MTQDEAFEILKSGQSVFLTGAAGSGKTYLLNKFIKYLRHEKIGAGVTASTGIAATHMNGRTIHSWAGIEIKDKLTDKELKKILKREKMQEQLDMTRVLIIDEISMLDAARLDLVDRICRGCKEIFTPFGGLQIVMCGDFFQLPPINRDPGQGAPFAWKAQAWKTLDPAVCYLTEQHRQDDDGFLSVLNSIRRGEVDEKARRLIQSRIQAGGSGHDDITKLYTHNIDVDALNQKELDRLPGEEACFHMTARGPKDLVKNLKKSCLAPEALGLKIGAKVMFVKNKYLAGGYLEYVNGTLGTVVGFDEENGFPLVKTKSDAVILAVPEDWQVEEDDRVLAAISQIPLRLAWAITVHKSQGMSLDEAAVDLSRCFEYGMGYVALSRLRSLDGLHLLGINNKAFEVHPEVREFDRGIFKI